MGIAVEWWWLLVCAAASLRAVEFVYSSLNPNLVTRRLPS